VDNIDLALLDIDSDAFQQNPYPWYREMRRTAPVCPIPGLHWFFVTTMILVCEVLADPVTYSSRVDKRREPPPELRRLRESRPDVVAPLLGNDPPSHTTYRRMANRRFTARTLRWMEGPIREGAAALAKTFPDEGDFLDLFAIPLPVYAISEILGLDEEQRGSVRRWTNAIASGVGATFDSGDRLSAEHDRADFDHTMLAVLESRRRVPGEDLLSRLVHAVDEEVAPEARAPVLLGLVRQLLVAGNETTAHLLAECVVLVADHPVHWERVRAAEPGHSRMVIEEALRLSSPVQQMHRRAARDVDLGGVRLRAGSQLLVSFASANRDDAVFEAPDVFAPGRVNHHRHLAFGQGIHTCLGAALARLVSRIALEVLAENLAGIRPLPGVPLERTADFERWTAALNAPSERR
jgi:cytochrome P450